MSRSAERTLVLCDGSIYSLLACAAVAEDAMRREAAGRGKVLLFPPSINGDDARERAMSRQADLFGLEAVKRLSVQSRPEADTGSPAEGSTSGTQSLSPATDGELETLALLSATYLAARAGCTRVLWPINAAVGESLDLDRIAQAHDRALLVSRLVALDAVVHAVPGIHVETPYVDLTDRQIADLAIDMDLPLDACWWWRDPLLAERKRWMEVLKNAGWVAATSA